MKNIKGNLLTVISFREKVEQKFWIKYRKWILCILMNISQTQKINRYRVKSKSWKQVAEEITIVSCIQVFNKRWRFLHIIWHCLICCFLLMFIRVVKIYNLFKCQLVLWLQSIYLFTWFGTTPRNYMLPPG